MNLATCHCRNTRGARCGKMGRASALQPHGRDRGAVRLRCAACGQVVSARTGTAYAGMRTEVTQYTLDVHFVNPTPVYFGVGKV